MGPTMRVKPGQTLWIKLHNNMTDPMLGPKDVNVDAYWKMLHQQNSSGGENNKINFQYYNTPIDDPSKIIVDDSNIPHNFDATNLHLHGLNIEVHLFDPVNTNNPHAPHIVIEPNQCYCYRFNIPNHQPGGLYWYHPHLHGSSALQTWSGLLGILYVDGPLEEELANYGVTHKQEFVIWDPAFKVVENQPTHNLEVDEFLAGQTALSKIHLILVNQQLTPNFDVGVNEVLWFRTLCGTVDNANTFIVYHQGQEEEPWDDDAIPFWVIASDGVTYPKPIQKHILVLTGGQREEILLQFDTPGKYVISQQRIGGTELLNEWGNPHNQILATITVTEDVVTQLPNIPISEMVLTPGYKEEETIVGHQVARTETVVFSMGTDRNMAPFPQYFINGKSFHPDRLDFFAQPGEAVEYVLMNANRHIHPFHIHVNRFQIKEMGSELSGETCPIVKAVTDFDPMAWHDTVVVPPKGHARIWVQYNLNYTGKTVFHCHFLTHEDTGMMSTLFIGQQEEDGIFRLEEYTPWLIGFAVVVAGALCFVMCWYRIASCFLKDKQLLSEEMLPIDGWVSSASEEVDVSSCEFGNSDQDPGPSSDHNTRL